MSLVNSFVLDLDLKNINYVSEPVITSSDSARFIVNVTDDGVPLDLTGSTTFTLASTRPDGVVILKSGSKTGSSQLTFDFGAPSTTVPGRVNSKVQMYDSSGRVSTINFSYLVVKDPSGTNYVPSSYDQTLIQEVLGEGPVILDAAETATTNANNAAANATTTANIVQAAEDIRIASEDDRIDSENTRQTNESTRITNETNRVSNENTRVSQETTRQSNETTRVANESGRVTGESARVSAESARANAEVTRISQETTRQNSYNTIFNNMQITWKGTVATYAALPSSNRTVGDVWAVTTDGTPANNGMWRWNGTAWVLFNALNPNGTALQSDVISLDSARADLFRTQCMSGVVDYVAPLGNIGVGISTASYPRGAVSTPYLPSFTMSMVNLFTTTAFSSLINGYKLNVTDIGGIATRNYMYLNAPPTFGTRDDLVFLEAWFPVGGTLGQMSWRIRTVAGVEFGTYPEGLGDPTSAVWASQSNTIFPQGGASSPVSFILHPSSGAQWTGKGVRNATSSTSLKIALDDQGLYIAGDGTSTSKTTLATADGYVYAIPLFRVKRRNSGGYRKDNLSGAINYEKRIAALGTFTTTDTLIPYNMGTDNETWLLANIGKRFIEPISGSKFTLLAVDTTNKKITINSAINANSGGGRDLDLVSDRPDSLFSNVIDASDIIDLRHRVPMTGLDYGYELDSAFDKLIRGESPTVLPKTTQSEQYGLKRAPLGITQQLKSTRITRTDGTSSDLVNLLGIDGNCEDISKFSASSTILSLDSTNKTIGNNSIKVTTTSSGVGFFVRAGATPSSPLLPLDSTKYYVIVADVKNGTSNGGVRIRYYNGTTTFAKTSSYSTEATKFVTHYIKIQPSEISLSDNRMYFDVNGNAAGQYGYIDSIRLYQIDQATYNLIDVDVNWTGGDNIAAKIPYVDSYPNFVENAYGNAGLTIGNGVPTWVENANYLDVTSDAASTSRYVQSRRISVLPNTNYLFSYTASNISGVDEPKTSIRKGSDNGVSAFVSTISGAGIKTYTFNTGSETEIILYFYASVNTASVQTKRYENIMIEKTDSTSSVYVPYGRYYLPQDYLSNAQLNNGLLPRYAYEGVNSGSFNTQRLNFSDAMTSQAVVDIVDPTWNGINKPKHVIPTQATSGVWASGDTIKLHSDYGVITGVNAQVTRVLALSTDGLTATLDDVSKFAVSDTFIIMDVTAGSSTARTITAIDTTNKTVTISVALSASAVGQIAVENTSATSTPQVAYTLQQGKTAQAGGTASITLASDASTVTDYYKGLQISGTFGGNFQTRTITAYNGSTKVATVDSNWANAPGSSSVYSISAPGTWSGLGTKDATFTFGTMPTAVDATLGNANTLNATIPNTVVYPPGKGISQVATDVLKAEVNGQELLAANTVSVKVNFAGKVSGNTDLVPHKANRTAGGSSSTTLLVPSNGSWIELNDVTTSGTSYRNIDVLAGGGSFDLSSTFTSVSGAISQHLFQLDIIRAIEDKFGEIPADGLAAKVAWVKTFITNLNCDWYGYGSNPAGNKATWALWNGSAWSATTTHTAATVSKITMNTSNMVAYIQSDGFAYFLAYADAAGVVANPTVAPTLSASGSGSGLSAGTYYVHYSWVASDNLGETVRSPEASITITAGQNIVISDLPVLPFGVQQANIYIGTVSGTTKRQSLTTVTTYTQTNALLINTADSPTVNTTTVPSKINTDYVELQITLKTANVSAYDATTDSAGYAVLQPTNPFPVLSENMLTAAKAFPVDAATSGSFVNGAVGSIISDKANIVPYATRIDTSSSLASLSDQALYLSEQIKSDNRMVSVSFYIKALSGSPVVNMKLQSVDSTIIWIADNAWTINVALTTTWTKYTLTGKMASNAWAARLAIATATASASFAISEVMINEGVVPLPWSAGRMKKTTLNLLGKVAGSTVENPNRIRLRSGNLSGVPTTETDFSEASTSQNSYDAMSKQDGVLSSQTTSTAGNYRQALFEFDLSYLGLSLSELKKAFRSLTATWVGYGSGDNASVLTYGASTKMWRADTASWSNWNFNSTSTPSSITNTTNSIGYITDNQKIYVLVYTTNPASATNPSTLYTDYVKLDVSLADYVDYVPANIVKIRPETKEMKLFFPNTSRRYLGHQGVCGENQVGLHYRYVPYQGQGSIGKSKILAVGTPIITTLGTGGLPSDAYSSIPIAALSTRLPSSVQDYNLIADKFTSEGVTTTFESLLLKQNPISTSFGYRLTPKTGLYFEPNGASITETVIRGNSIRPTLSTDTVAPGLGQSNYKFSLPTTLPSEALISLPMLVVNNSELQLVVVSFRKSKSSVLQFYSSDCIYDSFKIPGRPLVKGV